MGRHPDRIYHRFEFGGEEPTRFISVIADDYREREDGPSGPNAMMASKPFHKAPNCGFVVLTVTDDGMSYVELKDIGVTVYFGPDGTQEIREQFPDNNPGLNWHHLTGTLAVIDGRRERIAGQVTHIAMKAVRHAFNDSALVESFAFLRQIARKAKSDESKVWGAKMAELNVNMHLAAEAASRMIKIEASKGTLAACLTPVP